MFFDSTYYNLDTWLLIVFANYVQAKCLRKLHLNN